MTVHSGITTFLGPNGAGKTQLLRELKNEIKQHVDGKRTRYVSAGRLGPLENYRSNYDGQRARISYDSASYGNKAQSNARHSNESVTGDFATLTQRPDILIKVQERLRKLFNRDVRADWDGGNLKIYFSRVDTAAGEYSSAREASGLIHLVSILAALYDDEVGALLVDEPEVSLHPQLQSFLHQEMLKVAGDPRLPNKKLIFLSTHSTEFVQVQSVQDLASVVFCSDVSQSVVQIDPDNDEFQGKKIQALMSRMGQEHKLSFFCRRPLLVEGPSDQIMCSGISRTLNLNLEAAGSQILPVIGKGQFPVVTKLMRLIGKLPIVLADADAFTDSADLILLYAVGVDIDKSAVALGHRNASTFARDTHRDFCQLVDGNWADIQGIATNHLYWTNRDQARDDSIAKRRSGFCGLMSEDISELNNQAVWLAMRTRIESLFDLLNSAGCFILKRGAIESYYLHVDQVSSDEKPNVAAHEVSRMAALGNNEMYSAYTEIINSIEFASQAKQINETIAIRDLLLAIVTPALATVSDTTTDSELTSKARSMLGEMSSLFKLRIDRTDGLRLVVDLESEIMDIEGFPLTIAKNENPITSINNQLGLE